MVSCIKCFLEASNQHYTPYPSLFTAFVRWRDGEMITKTILSAMNKDLRRRHFVFDPQEACSLFGDFSWKTFCVGFVLTLYYQHSFLNTFYLLNGLRKLKESAFKLDKSRVPERRHLGDRYYIYEHEAIQNPISENNIGTPKAPQKIADGPDVQNSS